MHNQEIYRQFQRLDSLFKKTREASREDIEIQAHWAKYLCILCAGLLENAVSEIYGDFAKNSASTSVANYAVHTLKKIQNPKTNTLIEVARLFKLDWISELEQFVAENGRKDAIDSIMANRHLIAHGKDSGISVARLKEYFVKSIEVLDFIESKL